MTAKTRREQLLEMLAEMPHDPELHYMLGMEYVSSGAEEEALQAFQTALRCDPQYVPAYHQAGRTLVRLGRPAEAQQVLLQGIERARQQGQYADAAEMEGLLESLSL